MKQLLPDTAPWITFERKGNVYTYRCERCTKFVEIPADAEKAEAIEDRFGNVHSQCQIHENLTSSRVKIRRRALKISAALASIRARNKARAKQLKKDFST